MPTKHRTRRKTFNSMSQWKCNYTSFACYCHLVIKIHNILICILRLSQLKMVWTVFVGVFCACEKISCQTKNSQQAWWWKKSCWVDECCWARQMLQKVHPAFSYLSCCVFLWMSFLVLCLMCLIQPFWFCLITDETPTLLPLLLCTTSLAFSLHIFSPCPTSLFFPFFHLIFSFSCQCFNAVMDVHKAQFTSLAFSITPPVNSLPLPAS